jgi:hypothetical protein
MASNQQMPTECPFTNDFNFHVGTEQPIVYLNEQHNRRFQEERALHNRLEEERARNERVTLQNERVRFQNERIRFQNE